MRGRFSVGALMLAAGLLAGCTDPLPPQGQVLLFITTDAPLPSSSTGALGLFNRLRIDIFPAGELEPCTGCTRAFAVDAEAVDAGEASVGVVANPGEEGPRARVRLYRDGGTISGEPRPASTLEAVVQLPTTLEEGVVEVTVMLPIETVGFPEGTLEVPIEPALGRPAAGLVGSWSSASPTPCTVAASADQVCVPGGAFWMGDPRLDLSAVEDMDGALERLVVLSPFLLDRAEVTVAAFRASGLATSLVPNGPSDNPHEANTGLVGCTYTSASGPNDALPTTCVSWDRARAFCAALGRDLPTEAQLELAASNHGQSTFPWGEDRPACEDAVFARDDECAALGAGPAPAGSGARDRLVLDGGEIVDLAGNVIEWTADVWNRETEPCWGVGLFVDPLCTAFSGIDPTGRATRGGGYESAEVSLRAAVRGRVFNEKLAVSGLLGFRCVAPGR